MRESVNRCCVFFFFQAEDGIRDWSVTGVQTCALPIWCEVHANPGEKSEFECPRGTLGPFHQRGMLIEADLVWRELVTACRVRFRGALSPRKTPSGQRQSLALPCFCSGHAGSARRDPLSRAASAAYSSTTAAPQEYFGLTGSPIHHRWRVRGAARNTDAKPPDVGARG